MQLTNYNNRGALECTKRKRADRIVLWNKVLSDSRIIFNSLNYGSSRNPWPIWRFYPWNLGRTKMRSNIKNDNKWCKWPISIILCSLFSSLQLVQIALLCLIIENYLPIVIVLTCKLQPKLQKLLRFPDVRNEYLSSLRHLLNILGDYSQNETQNSRAVFDELKNEVKHIDGKLMGRT